MTNLIKKTLPIPPFFNAETVGCVWRVPYQERAKKAKILAKEYQIEPSVNDKVQIALLIIDAQNTFCIPDFELFVGGRSGMGAVEDNVRLCEFIYRNLNAITTIIPTLDTHTAMQIFHPIFWVNEAGENPPPHTTIQRKDLQKGTWQVNPAMSDRLTQKDYQSLQSYALHYVKKLDSEGKYPLTIWPYHSMLGGIGHALVPAVEEAIFFHTIARQSPNQFELKGNHPLTENYSVLSPEVLEDEQGNLIMQKNNALIEKLLHFDKILIAGQAKSHCVAWTIDNLLTEIQKRNLALAQKVYLLEDCMSSVVIPGIVDFTEPAETSFQKFAQAGMHRVTSTGYSLN